MPRSICVITSTCLFLTLSVRSLAEEDLRYDPLSITSSPVQEPLDLTVRDDDRDRELPVLVYLSAATTPSPVILFSHGLGGSRRGSAYLGRHWSGRGYVVVFVQHPGSDDSVWRDKPVLQRMTAMRTAANLQNTLNRFQDIPAVLDQLESWNDKSDHPLHGRLDLKHVGMSGHSYGAVTTQAVSGQSLSRGRQPYTDPRIKAALPMSPSSPRGKRLTANDAFGKVSIPWLLMTGTKDTAPIGDQTVESRLAVYPALPQGASTNSSSTTRSTPRSLSEPSPAIASRGTPIITGRSSPSAPPSGMRTSKKTLRHANG